MKRNIRKQLSYSKRLAEVLNRSVMHVAKLYLWNMSEIFIHPSAIVDEGAQIGNGTRIWHFTHVMPKAVIGNNCIIGQNVYVDNNAIVGNGVKIQNNVSVYNGVELEDGVF